MTSTTQNLLPDASKEMTPAGVACETAPPSVSVIIPAYNAAAFISETLASVFSQTFTDFEVLVVNDGSPDTEEFEQAIQPYRERIRYLCQQNSGASAARNIGLRAARGALVAFLDADDLWSPNYLAAQLKFMREYDCDLACADAMIFGVAQPDGRTYMDEVMETAPPTGRLSFLDLVSGERSLITSGVLARRDLILRAGLFDVTLRNAQDFDLWLRLAQLGGKIAYHRRVLLQYRKHPDSLSGDAFNSHFRELRVFEKIEQSYEFTPAERAEVDRVIRKRRAQVEFELGKLYLVKQDFSRAQECFAKSSNLRRSWKAGISLWLTRLAPGLFRTLYGRRIGNLNG